MKNTNPNGISALSVSHHNYKAAIIENNDSIQICLAWLHLSFNFIRNHSKPYYIDINYIILIDGYANLSAKYLFDNCNELSAGNYRLLNKLKGGFFIRIIDLNKNILMCITDKANSNTYYYHRSNDYFIVASRVDFISKRIAKYYNINQEPATQYIIRGWNYSNNTLFTEIQKIPAATIEIFNEIKSYNNCY